MGRGEHGKLGSGSTNDIPKLRKLESLHPPTRIRAVGCSSRATFLLSEMPIFGGSIDSHRGQPPPFLVSLIDQLLDPGLSPVSLTSTIHLSFVIFFVFLIHSIQKKEERINTFEMFKDSSDSQAVQDLCLRIESNPDSSINLTAETPRSLASVLCKYFRELRKPVFPPHVRARMLQACIFPLPSLPPSPSLPSLTKSSLFFLNQPGENVIEGVPVIQEVLRTLPDSIKSVIKKLLLFLNRVSSTNGNNVNPLSLAQTFSKGLFGSRRSDLLSPEVSLMRLLISFGADWFSDDPEFSAFRMSLQLLPGDDADRFLCDLSHLVDMSPLEPQKIHQLLVETNILEQVIQHDLFSLSHQSLHHPIVGPSRSYFACQK